MGIRDSCSAGARVLAGAKRAVAALLLFGLACRDLLATGRSGSGVAVTVPDLPKNR
jgi:hypothetical protein